MPQIIEVPGHGQVEFPDGMTDEQIVSAIRSNMPKQKGATRGALGMAGDSVAGLARGAGSIGATLMWPFDKLTDAATGNAGMPRNEERRLEMDEALRLMGADPKSGAYGAGKLGAEILGAMGVGGGVAQGVGRLAPAMASKAPALMEALASSGMRAGGATGLKGAATRAAGGGLTGGLSAGLVEPESAGMGAGLGAALPGAVRATGAAMSRLGGALLPRINQPDLAAKAIRDYNIPLGISDIAESKMLKGARSVLDDTWLIGRMGTKSKEKVQSAFNREVGKTFGEAAPKLTPEVMDSAKKRLGGEFDRIWNNNTVAIDAGLIQDLQAIRSRMSSLNPEQAAQVDRQMQGLLQAAQGLDIPGSFVNNWQAELRMAAEGEKGLHQKVLGDLRKSVLAAFNRSVSPDDAKALTTTQRQYKAFKTVDPLMQKAQAGVAGRPTGDVPAGLLPEAVRQSYRGNIAHSPFRDLSQIGSQYIADRVARTGGGPRALIQNSAVGSGLVGAGAMSEPGMAMFLGGVGGILGAAGEKALTSPLLARGVVPKTTSTQSLLAWLDLQERLAKASPALLADQ
jgi:hypothetical protein